MGNYDWQKVLRALPLLNDLLFRGAISSKAVEGLNMTQRKILLLLADRSPVSQAEILPYTDRDKGAVSKVIQSLVEKKYIHREHSSEDRRKVSLSLTKRGTVKANILNQDLFAHFTKVFSALEEKELDGFYTSLEKLLSLSLLISQRLTSKE
ncbi:MAG: MarR family transcriptional regulator [Spirochaetales bacterium]|jgi:DNA-binding MarR family transcriptional regulator|nr:MarR family transcriptional regulator [Spirochaetales bacterium]